MPIQDDLINSLAAKIGTDDPPLAVGLDGIEDPRNMGSIVRTRNVQVCMASFIPERRATGTHRRCSQSRSGALEYVPVARVTNLVRLIEELKERNIWVVGATGNAAQAYTDWDWNLPVAVFLGNEGRGLHRLVSERCDTLVRIPVNGQIESLNVSVAAGVLALRSTTTKGDD
jgi:23S rRNA (guanosine2251-2'-O)-methyltransferase